MKSILGLLLIVCMVGCDGKGKIAALKAQASLPITAVVVKAGTRMKTGSITDPEKYWSFDHQTISFNTINHKH